jgi:GT2 family glycosyltransferase
MQIIDVIILTNTKTEKNLTMTLRTIYTLRDSEVGYKFNVHLVESGDDHTKDYFETGIVANYIKPNEPFNYNKFINIAMDYVTSDWVIISNNDVGYEKNWLSEIMIINKERPDIHSFSPRDPALYIKYFDWHFINSPSKYFEEYTVHEALMGWCLVVKKEALDKIGPFDEQFDMYYQDNDYARMLIKHGIKHALVKDSIVCHLKSVNISKLSPENIKKMEEDKIKFKRKWG